MVIVTVLVVLVIIIIISIVSIVYFRFILGELIDGGNNGYTKCPLNSSTYGRGVRRVPFDGCRCNEEDYEWNDTMDKCNIIASKTD